MFITRICKPGSPRTYTYSLMLQTMPLQFPTWPNRSRNTKITSRLAEWVAANILERLMIFSFPIDHRQHICTTKGMELLNHEILRKAHVVRIFPKQTSFLRLVFAVHNSINDEELTGRIYLNYQGSD